MRKKSTATLVAPTLILISIILGAAFLAFAYTIQFISTYTKLNAATYETITTTIHSAILETAENPGSSYMTILSIPTDIIIEFTKTPNKELTIRISIPYTFTSYKNDMENFFKTTLKGITHNDKLIPQVRILTNEPLLELLYENLKLAGDETKISGGKYKITFTSTGWNTIKIDASPIT